MIGGVWAMFLYVAEGVRDGKRPQHKEAIEAKADLYRWIERRTDFMLAKMTQATNGSNVSIMTGSLLDAEHLISYLQS